MVQPDGFDFEERASTAAAIITVDGAHVREKEILPLLVLSFWISHILMKNKFRLALLAIAPYVGLPNTRSTHFIWVDYMQY